MGHIVDFVPNHMGIGAGGNAWWTDVLENGPSSPASNFFDIDWAPLKAELHAKLLLPILGDQYGQVLERGELKLEFHDGALVLRYFDNELPINPRQAPRVYRLAVDPLTEELGTDSPASARVPEYPLVAGEPSGVYREGRRADRRAAAREGSRQGAPGAARRARRRRWCATSRLPSTA